MEKKKSETSTVNEGQSENPRQLLQKNVSTVIVVGGVLLVVVVAVLTAWCINRQEEIEEPTWEDTAIEKLRTFEVEPDQEFAVGWQDVKGYPLDYTVPYALFEAPRFESGKKLYTVGTEDIFTNDFNYVLFLHHFEEFSSGKALSDDLLLEVIGQISRESIVLQEAEGYGYITLDDGIFNAENKDYNKRGVMHTSAEVLLQNKIISEVSTEMVTIWFLNMEAPEMGVDAARDIALEKISEIREKILDGALTFEEAGAEIAQDPVLAEIDPALETNSYSRFTFRGKEEVIIDPLIQEEISGLSEGEISGILTGRDGADNLYDAYFMVAGVTKVSEGFEDYEEWLDGMMGSYDILVY